MKTKTVANAIINDDINSGNIDDQRNYYLTIINNDDQLRKPPTATAPSTLSASFICPEQFGYFADKKDCSHYYVCVFGDPLHEQCTGGLYFSAELQTCDWPQNVDCTVNMTSSVATNFNILSENNDEFKNMIIELNKTIKMTDNNNGKNESSTEKSITINFDYGNNDIDNTDSDESIASFVDTNGEVFVHDDDTPNGPSYSLLERTNFISDNHHRDDHSPIISIRKETKVSWK